MPQSTVINFYGQHLAAIDLGSNSFHMIVVHYSEDKQVKVLDRLRESVRLASGLNARGNLSKAAQERALACLQRFGERIRDLPSYAVAAVGTNTLRLASQSEHSRDFLLRAEQALGHPIAVVSGYEEARLIYLGVSHFLTHEDMEHYRFVMDIGGGSTELMIGRGFDARYLESLKMGCVSSSETFFTNGRLDKICWKKAITSARLHLVPIAEKYRTLGWDSAIGASGTIRAVRKVLQQSNLSPYDITLENMYTLKERMIAAGHIDKLKLAGLSEERKPVFAGGLAILIATFESLGIQKMHVSDWALREGLIYDRVQRFQQADSRGKTVKALQQRFDIDVKQATSVRLTAECLFDFCLASWNLEPTTLDLLRWSADLYEIGLVIAHSDYQKHGAYLLGNANMPGFSNEEQHWLSTLVRTHRAKLSKKLFTFPEEADNVLALRLSVILRLAVLLNRARQADMPELQQFSANDNSVLLTFSEANLCEARPLLCADLEREQSFLKAVGIQLQYTDQTTA